jgi:hypothetical protein
MIDKHEGGREREWSKGENCKKIKGCERIRIKK